MNRTDRLFAIVLELQRHGERRAEDLAETFEVSKRTIYRDVQALAESGIPLVEITGRGYSLIEDYFLPPVNFSSDEALMLLLGSDILEQHFDAQYQRAAETASSKIESILPLHLKNMVSYLRQNISMFAMKDMNRTKSRQLAQIRRAIIERRILKIHYTRRYVNTDQSVREIAPYSLASLEHDWYLMAYCFLREGLRVFRLSRIDQLDVLPKRFERPKDFDPNWIDTRRPHYVTIKAWVSNDIIRWIHEDRPFALVHEEPCDDGWQLTFHVRHEDELFHWLLGWGSQLRILEPDSLRQKLINEIEQMLEVHQPLLT